MYYLSWRLLILYIRVKLFDMWIWIYFAFISNRECSSVCSLLITLLDMQFYALNMHIMYI